MISAITPRAPAPTDEIDTRRPSTMPTSTVCSRGAPRVEFSNARAIGGDDRSCRIQARTRSRNSATLSTSVIRLRAASPLRLKCDSTAQRERSWRECCRLRAGFTTVPIDTPRQTVHKAATGLGRGRVKQVGADRGRRMDAEQQDQNRRHQRSRRRRRSCQPRGRPQSPTANKADQSSRTASSRQASRPI